MQSEKIIKEIQDIIKAVNKTESIDELINYNLKLAGYLFFLNETKVKALKTHLESYHQRKTEQAVKAIEMDGNSQAERERKAEIAVKELKEVEIVSEVVYERLKSVVSSTDSVIQVLTQKISYLKKQFEAK
jgi:hypothetical protein